MTDLPDKVWAVIGMGHRLQELAHAMHDAAVDGKHITVYADDELIGTLNIDYTKE